MKRPTHPQHSDLFEPKKSFSRSESILLGHSWEGVLLATAVAAWNKALKDHETQEHRIVKGPFIENNYLKYTYEWENRKYQQEKEAWDSAMAEYKEKMAAFLAYEESKKTALPNLDDKIRRAEERLANLKAAKAGQPLPFPEAP